MPNGLPELASADTFHSFMGELIKLVKRYQKSRDHKERLDLADEIVVIVSPPLHLYICLRCPKELVDDVLQETLIAIALRLDTFEGDTDQQFYGFCHIICRNKIVDALRRHTRKKQRELSSEDIWEAVMNSEAEAPMAKEQREILRGAMELLAAVRPPCKLYLESHYIDGLTFAEMSVEFSFPSEDAARMATRRCLQLARELLEE